MIIMTVWFANDPLFARTFGLISNILLPPLHTEKDVGRGNIVW